MMDDRSIGRNQLLLRLLKKWRLHFALQVASAAKESVKAYAPGSAESAPARSRHSETAAECDDDDDCSSPAVDDDGIDEASAERRAHTSSPLLLTIVRAGQREGGDREHASRAAPKHRRACFLLSLCFLF